ncbi:hypothetical protein F5Y17DRAFT_249235 [Xylariaceae sp. FL0594]|nr:hypothetical protein F5Y17DRAFT_249235 [Xylariaceae sp. FL0594]
MDPVSALGVAAAALQFLDASLKAYGAFQEISSSAEGSMERNRQLEDNIRAAQDLEDILRALPALRGIADPVAMLTTKCNSQASDLLAMLEYVRGYGQDISPIRASWRLYRKRGSIEKLRSSLANNRVALDQMISMSLASSIGNLSLQQSQEFKSLESNLQGYIVKLSEHQEAQADQNMVLKEKLDLVQEAIQLHRSKEERSRLHTALLESLWFPEIDNRHSDISE